MQVGCRGERAVPPAGAGRRPRRAAAALVGLALAAAGSLAACDGAGSDVVQNVASTTRTGCPTQFPHRLTLTTSGRLVTPPLREMLACTSDTGLGPVLLVNNGLAVWSTVAPGHVLRSVGGTTWTRWLTDRVAAPDGIVLPGSSVLVWAAPTELSWVLRRDWTVAWTSLQAGLQALPAEGDDSQQSALAPGSVRGRALISCSLSALHVFRAAAVPPPAAPAPPILATVPPTPGAPTPYAPISPATPTGPAASPGGLDGLDALDATWSPAATACAADWQRADRILDPRAGTFVRWWTAWQRAKGWLDRSARELNWLDEPGTVVVRTKR